MSKVIPITPYEKEIKQYNNYVKIHTIRKDNKDIHLLRTALKDYKYDPLRPHKMRVGIDEVRRIYFSIVK